MTSLKSLAIRGAIWTFAGYGLSQGLRLVSNLILTRLLEPELFGLMALVTTFLIGLNMFSDVGFAPNIIQSKRGDDPDFLNTAWSLQVLRGFVLWAICQALALPVAEFYNDSRLIGIVPLVGLTMIFAGFNSTSLYTLNRQMLIGKLTLLELVTQIIALVVMVTWAWLSPSIWALIVGNLVAALLKTILSHRLIPNYTNRFAWERAAVREIFSFGKWIFVSTAMTFFATQADRMIMGKLLSFSMLGIYTVAFTFASLPQQVIGQLSGKMILPLMSQFAHLPRESFRAKILSKRKGILTGVGLLIILLVCFGDILILKFYDSRYAQAAWMLPILALGIWPYLLFDTSRTALMAIGKPNYQAYGQLAKSLHVCIGLFVGYYYLGVLGIVIAIALNDIELYFMNIYGLWREELSTFQQDLKATLLLLLGLAIVLAGRYFLGFGFPLDTLFA
ncbi:membrane protein involved in the export of O-antigen and teichoic acid [Pleurocapsa sp. PCC 7327]|uniref:oligosaccharide flippase family protein n=1 Tax=Pleurocapsa sp. PCC 7327 TaxID=118163 RepID=UPI00029FED4D|nr:oligosaccharide flippase family protein [Pleurocapsa sp. PCC 7327]AFY79430.1 membrane protein involved in the export of O-antigen and teichoic acid [Pleurocapsa sp. PCC 7327]